MLTAPLRQRLALCLALTLAALSHDARAQQGSRPDFQPAGALVVESRGVGRSTVDGRPREIGLVVQLEEDSLARHLGNANARGRALGRSVEARRYLEFLHGRHANFEAQALSAVPGARVGHRLSVVLNAVALVVPEGTADRLKGMPGVKAVLADSKQQPQTISSPGYIGAPSVWNQLGGQGSAGENVIVGVIDSGVWPEHPSLSDPGPSGPYGPPAGWNGAPCQFGSPNPNDAPFACNNKVIGARRIMSTYDSLETLLPGEYASARDDSGHGTLLATIAAGNAGVTASIAGNTLGTASGVAPRAQIASYKVCGNDGCYASDTAAAVEQAILDGVDVLDVAVAGGEDPYSDVVSLALLDAYNAGIFVAAAAGNNGNGALGRLDPWTMTAGATTLNRQFQSTLTVRAGTKSLVVTGASITPGLPSTAIINAADFGDQYCAASTPNSNFVGKIVVCARGGNGRVEKSRNVQLRGAVGMVLINPSIAGTSADTHFVPTVHLEKTASDNLLAFLAVNTNETASFTAGAPVTATGDVMASFTSRGGATQALGISKPDLAAPGSQIVGGMTPQPATLLGGPAGQSFVVIDGTSLSSAHLAGAGALLKALHPEWTPAHIRSALMLTAGLNVKKEDGTTKASQFDTGAGRLDLTAAGRPGLAITAPGSDFMSMRSRLWDVNYPSVYVPAMPGVMTVRRTLENLENTPASWSVYVATDPDVTILVPTKLTFQPRGSANLDMVINAATVPVSNLRGGWIVLVEDGGTRVLHLPIIFMRWQNGMPVLTTCNPTTIKVGTTTACTLTVANVGTAPIAAAAYDTLPAALPIVTGSVSGGVQSGNSAVWQGTLAAATPGGVDVRVGPPEAGYLSLASYYAPIACTGSCDDRVFTGPVPSGIRFNGSVYTQVSFSTNGLVQLGGDATTSPVNVQLPDAAAPNNLLAPFWTDMHPAGTDGKGSGKLYIGYITLGSLRTWVVIEWADVITKGTTLKHSFQVWLQAGGQTEDITYTYDKLSSYGAGGFLTIGAENATGTAGTTYFYNGAGTPPAVRTDLIVTSPKPSPGGSATIGFQATGATVGTWTHCGVLVQSGTTDAGVSCLPITVQK
jgi:subtilisin family serine protease